MRASRRRARDLAKSVRTRADLEAWLDALNLSDDERTVARMVYERGFTRQQIAFETGYSLRQVNRLLAKVHDKMA